MVDMDNGNDRGVVFLDIDGVLNTPRNYSEYNEDRRARGIAWGDLSDTSVEFLFDRKLVKNLNELVKAGAVDLVVSSSWRMFYDGADGRPTFDELRLLLKRVGVQASILGPTPIEEQRRGPAILEWLRANRPGGTRMAILDDEPPGNFGPLRRWLIQTDPDVGLATEELSLAVLKLREPGWSQ